MASVEREFIAECNIQPPMVVLGRSELEQESGISSQTYWSMKLLGEHKTLFFCSLSSSLQGFLFSALCLLPYFFLLGLYIQCQEEGGKRLTVVLKYL